MVNPHVHIKDRIEKEHELRMLDGNIARISVTDDLQELDNHYKWAIERIKALYQYKYLKLENKI